MKLNDVCVVKKAIRGYISIGDIVLIKEVRPEIEPYPLKCVFRNDGFHEDYPVCIKFAEDELEKIGEL